METQLHMFLFPVMAPGHIIPIVDMAKLLSSRGVKITIVTTPINSISISNSIHNNSKSISPSKIHLLILKFPSAEVGLPDGCENLDFVTNTAMIPKFISAFDLFQTPFEEAVREHRPHCIVVDMFFPWANDVAAKFGIPRLNFHGTGFFSTCASEFIRIHEPYKHVSSETEPFFIPCLPGEITFTKMKLPEFMWENYKNDLSEFMKRAHEANSKCYGLVMNSFYELEAEYAECYRNVLGRKAWHIGPLSLYNKGIEEKAQRGNKSAIDEHECLKWLDSQKPNSVVYVSFGSMAKFNADQLKEIAIGLEASEKFFIWVVRKVKGDEEKGEDKDWLPEGYEERMEGKGMIIRGWAPQVLILDHPGVGGFVTHCGWNSTLEGVAAGVPMVTWPVAAEQFYNEKLLTEVLKIGVGVGVQKWVRTVGDFIKSEAVEKAIRRVMEGKEAEEMRNKAKELAEMAKKAITENGSSYSDLEALIKELKSFAF
ncbi:scopoletin glucosyltransferase-like [Cucumis melo var. makuwa]|uniref:Glycosyltransferase n=2 Tax=Cucumis melo TaxID=3656 RepID=A0A1S4E0C3_CUCME|nr:scopoletin glucosyltransferase-like [Cucumis melo]KAA0031312.1 scopoletin glucosyltransferase-like [Cucumis melo var. makuwa]TYK06764.1 scopoletin glucosyltransferase-like [Cucumis melo var. makuwa]